MRHLKNVLFGYQYDGELSGLEAIKIAIGCAICLGLVLGFGPALIWVYELTH